MAGTPGYSNLGEDVEMLLGESVQMSEDQKIRSTSQQRPRVALLWSALLVGSALAVIGWTRGRPAWSSTLGTTGLAEDTAPTPAPQCFEGGTEELEMTMPAFDDKEVSVPKIPKNTKRYRYASTNALVSIPNSCYEKFKNKIEKNTTIQDRGAATGSDTAYFYIRDLKGGYKTLSKMNDCACGLVIEMHGSGGPGWTAGMFAALFSKAGYIVVLPNSMAMPDKIGLKGRLPLKAIEDIDTTNYCGAYTAFDEKCSKFSKPFCYSTKVDNILNDPDTYRKYVEGVYEIRKREVDYFVSTAARGLLDAFETVFLAGNSEGAMAASRYHHPDLDAKLKGRILSAWSCNFNYFVSCPDNARVCEDKCDKSVPQLNLIGLKDEYFGAEDDTVAVKVAANKTNGYGGPITGNCRAMYDQQKFDLATVVTFEDSYHGPQYYNDNTWRNVIGDFIAKAGDKAADWPSLKACTETDRVWDCPKDGPTTCKTINGKYQVNPEATFVETTPIACPA